VLSIHAKHLPAGERILTGSKRWSGPLERALAAPGDPPQQNGEKDVRQKKRQGRNCGGEQGKEHDISRAIHERNLEAMQAFQDLGRLK
jgi:hypothetical protein